MRLGAGGAGLALPPALAGRAHASREHQLNREAKADTRRVFEELGYRVGPSETNFIMVDIRRDAKEFKAACLTRGIAVGRQFPPFGQAGSAFRSVLAAS